MLSSELRDLFTASYKVECQKHNTKEVFLPDKLIASWMASGQQEICDRLGVLINYYDIYYEPVTEYQTYDLPEDWGKLIRTEPELKIVDIGVVETHVEEGDTLETGDINSIAIYNDGDGWKCALSPLPTTSDHVRIWYYPNPQNYSPSKSAPDLGSFDGSTFNGSLKLPDKYQQLLLFYMLGQCFMDIKMEYEERISRERGNLGSTQKQEIEYTPIGGYD